MAKWTQYVPFKFQSTLEYSGDRVSLPARGSYRGTVGPIRDWNMRLRSRMIHKKFTFLEFAPTRNRCNAVEMKLP